MVMFKIRIESFLKCSKKFAQEKLALVVSSVALHPELTDSELTVDKTIQTKSKTTTKNLLYTCGPEENCYPQG